MGEGMADQGAALREARPDDGPALVALYADAFPDEDLAPLAFALTGRADTLSLAATVDADLVGHVAFSFGTAGQGDETVALLGPLAVAPARQRGGVGSALVREGLARPAARGAALALVLGDPAYYARFGFAPETAVRPPYPLPPHWAPAWAGLALRDGPRPAGVLRPPEPWLRPEFWGP